MTTEPLQYIRLPIPNDLRVELFLYNDGGVMLWPSHGFIPTVEERDGIVCSWFMRDGFSLRAPGDDVAQEYAYETRYPLKIMPLLKQWLVQQQLLLNE